MRKTIQRNLIMVVALTVLVAYGIIIFFVYGSIRTQALAELKNEADYVTTAINISGESYLERLDQVEPDTRVTLISSTGDVLYDTKQDEYSLENHSNRPEVADAFRYGKGSDVRESDTLGQEMYYYAEKLDDGNIIRLAKSMSSVLFMALQIMPSMFLIMVSLLVVATLLSYFHASRLVDPINRINLNHPLDNQVYPELNPLLQRIDAYNKEKAQSERLRREFTANVSHELKTPLTSISGYAEIMQNGLVKPEDTRQFAGRIYKESQRLVTLIDDIMDLSKLDEGAVDVKKEELDLNEIAGQVIDDLKDTAKRYQIQTEIQGEPSLMQGVDHVIYEMIYNLVLNSIKYNHPGGKVQVIVDRGADPEDKHPILQVIDTGIGIPEDEVDRIFERFYRVDKSRSKESGGTGLGLSIVKHGALIHGATIKVESKLGQGTCMTIQF